MESRYACGTYLQTLRRDDKAMDAKMGDWVRVYNIALGVGERAATIPEDTQGVALEMWSKGFLLNKGAKIGDDVEVETYIGRRVKGKLCQVNPYWDHDFGKGVPELLYIGRQAREILEKEVK